MKIPQVLLRPQRGRDLCHLAFRQTLDLLQVTDEALEELCHESPQVPDLDSLVLRALNEMTLGETDGRTRAPTHVFLVHGPGPPWSGILYRLGPTGYVAVAGPIRLEADEGDALATGAEAVTVSNQPDEGVDRETYQKRFHPALRNAVADPIHNFVSYRIPGDWSGAIVALNYPGQATRYEAQVLSALSVTLGSLWTLASRVAQVEEGFIYLVGALARASEVNDQVTGDHILRVSRYAETLSRTLGYTPEEARTIAYSSELHDVGKIHTPRELLLKPGPLAPREVAVVRQHTLQGEKIIGTAPRLAVARKIAGAHHENWDGSGYPRGLVGAEIPRQARLVKVVDVYDALRSERPYKQASTHEEAVRVMTHGDDRIDPGRHFDPEMLQAFRAIHSEFQRIHAEIQPWE
jgi:HD-GYP domain-containing protein (c-di-GMP phosphodiesterase class II)